jgi:hypothetical protein
MAVSARIDIYGVQQALKELHGIDPSYRKQVTKNIKNAGQVIVNEARSMVANYSNSLGNGAPLSGMVRGNMIKGRETSYRTDAVQKGFKVKVGARATKERYVNFNKGGYTQQVVFGALPYRIMVIQQVDAAGAIYDHAGRNTSSLFITNLNAEEGEQPRVVDKAVDKNQAAVEIEVIAVVADVMEKVNRKMRITYGN